jgi:hypothetical protein
VHAAITVFREDFMKFPYQYMFALIGLALSTVWFAVQAADKLPAADRAADADAVVPATRYQSILSYASAKASNRSPDQNWKVLNEQVGAYDSMALTMGDPREAKAADAAQAAAPASTAADQHPGHGGPARPAAATATQQTDGTRKDLK